MFQFSEKINELLKNEHFSNKFSNENEEKYEVKTMPLQDNEDTIYGYSFEDNEVIVYDKDYETVHSYSLTEVVDKDTISDLEEELENYKNKLEDVENYEQKVKDLEEEVKTLKTEKEEAVNNFTKVNDELQNLKDENEQLEEYKLQKETEAKMNVISKYAEILDEEEEKELKESLEDYTVEELKYKLGVKAFEVFSQEENHTYNLNNDGNANVPSWVKAIKERRNK